MSNSKKQKVKSKDGRKRYALSSAHVNDVRQKHAAESEASRKRWRQRHQKRSQWGRNDYVDDDMVSRMLVKWPFAQLVQHSKLLVLLINRRSAMPTTTSTTELPGHVASLVYYKHPSEYYETLFADYTSVQYADYQTISFRAYYTHIYREASRMVEGTDEDRVYHTARLRACFMVALTYDARVRRFVFSNHDIHYEHMHTHPPPMAKTAQFIESLRPAVDYFLASNVDTQAEALADEAFSTWLTHYMFLLQ